MPVGYRNGGRLQTKLEESRSRDGPSVRCEGPPRALCPNFEQRRRVRHRRTGPADSFLDGTPLKTRVDVRSVRLFWRRLYVLDGDGVCDLLVGEYGDGKFPDEELPACLEEGWKRGGRFANGRVRIYKNHGTNTQPRFEDFEYLKAGGGIATVPIT